jgi:hypothetical protein
MTSQQPIERDLDAYLSELDGAVGLLQLAQAAEGDARLTLLDLAADAWIAARDFGGFSQHAVDLLISEFEIERMAHALIEPDIYVEMIRIYLVKRLAAVRAAMKQIEEVN